MMSGAQIMELPHFVDDRGELLQVLDAACFQARRAYVIRNGVDVVRAWHGHCFEGKCFVVLQGRFKFGVRDMKTDVVTEFYLSDNKAQALIVPPGNYNGFRSFGKGILLVFSDKTLEESKNDDVRLVSGVDFWEVKHR